MRDDVMTILELIITEKSIDKHDFSNPHLAEYEDLFYEVANGIIDEIITSVYTEQEIQGNVYNDIDSNICINNQYFRVVKMVGQGSYIRISHLWTNITSVINIDIDDVCNNIKHKRELKKRLDQIHNDLIVEKQIKKQMGLMALLENNTKNKNIVKKIENIDLAIEWVKNGNNIEKFYLLEQNKCDLKLAFEINKIIKILQ